MKEIFAIPTYEIVRFPREDVVCASQTIDNPQGTGGIPGPTVPLP